MAPSTYISVFLISVEPQSIDRLHGRRFLRGVKAEDHTNSHREEDRHYYYYRRQTKADITYDVYKLHRKPGEAYTYKATHYA